MENTFVPSTHRILLVDDNPAIHDDYRKILQLDSNDAEIDELGALLFDDDALPQSTLPAFEIDSAMQGQEAFEMSRRALAEGRPYALAFVDMRMPPGWDGLQTIEHLWQVDPNLQVVICTAFSDYSWSEIIDRIAFRDRLLLLKKPFDNIEVCQLAIALTHKWELERQTENQMDAIVETAAEGIITTHADWVIDSCNGATCQLFGYDREELHGKAFDDLLSDSEDESSANHDSTTFVKNAADRQQREILGRRKDGSLVPILLSISDFNGWDGPRHTIIVRDLTGFKSMQDRLARAQRLKSLGQLAAGVAHEINNPLQAVYCNISILRSSVDAIHRVLETCKANISMDCPAKPWETRWREVCEIISENQYEEVSDEIPVTFSETMGSLERIVYIVQTLQELYALEQADMSRVDLNHVIDSAVALTSDKRKGVASIEVQKTQDNFKIDGNASDLFQVMVNLIKNAAESVAVRIDEGSNEPGIVTVRTAKEEKHAIITVEDNGVGIADSVRDNIFEPFFTTKEGEDSVGQGLAIVYNTVVNKHGGTIEVESQPGQGATFTVRLPWEFEAPVFPQGCFPNTATLSCSTPVL